MTAASVRGDPHWSRVTLELELGEAPVPAVGSDYAQAGAEIDPALEGVAVRRGNEWTVAHPAVLQALDAAGSPEQTLLSLVMQHGLPARELAEIPAAERVALSQFSATRIIQSAPDAGPVLVHRGSRVRALPTPAEASEVARERATAIAAWFARSMIKDASATEQRPAPAASESMAQLGLRGDYEPSDDTDNPMFAPPSEQALAAYALARFARISGVSEESQRTAEATALAVLTALASKSEVESDPISDAKAQAFVVLAGAALGPALGDASPAATLVRNARATLKERITPRTDQVAAHVGGDLLEQAVTLAALATLAADSRDPRSLDEVRDLVDRLWSTPDRTQILGILDWLLVADRALGATSETHASLARAARMALSRAQLGMSQDGQRDAGAVSPDLAGAFALSGVGGRGASGQTARPGHALALMLADPILTPVGERFRARSMQIALLRFLDQLAYDDVSCYLCPNPRRALGALRTAPWDSTVAVAGNAMGLLCLAESAIALDRINEALPSVETSDGSPPAEDLTP